MPIDPYFTSAVKDDWVDRACARQAVAKACRMRGVLQVASKEARVKIRKRLSVNRDVLCAKGLFGKLNQADSLRPSLVGFKSPKKKWIHRDSRHPDV